MDALADLRRATCSDGAPSARSLLLTLFADCLAPHGIGITVSVPDLTTLVAPFGADQRLVRTSLTRLADRGLLAPTAVGRRSFYGVAPSAVDQFRRAERRVYGPLHPKWDGRWTIVVVDPGEGTARQRSTLRDTLADAGFGTAAPNVLASPIASVVEVAALVSAAGLSDALVARCELALPVDGATLARRSIDLTRVADRYAALVDRFGGYPTDVVAGLDGEQALKLRMLLVATYRNAILDEPVLPAGLVPDDWIGSSARAEVARLYDACAVRAEQHFAEVLGLKPRVPAGRFKTA